MKKSVLCIGATLVDELYFCEQHCIPSTSNPATKTSSIGGVVSNIAQHLGLLQLHPSLITALGADADAAYITKSLNQKGIVLDHCVYANDSTGKYISIMNPDGNLVVAVCQDISSTYLTPDFLKSKSHFIAAFDLVILDTNIPIASIQWLIDFAKTHRQKLIIEPVSVAKASKLAALDLEGVFMITPNEDELRVIATSDTSDEVALVQSLFRRGVQQVWIRKGNQGSVIYTATQSLALQVPEISISDSTGAGDAALAGWVFGCLNGENEETCLQLAHALALEVLQIKGAVLQHLNSEYLYQIKNTYYNEHL
jgi:pseudouridine kinase